MTSGGVVDAGAAGSVDIGQDFFEVSPRFGRGNHETGGDFSVQFPPGGGHRVGCVEPILEESKDGLTELSSFLVSWLEASWHSSARLSGMPAFAHTTHPNIYDHVIYHVIPI